MNCLEEFISDRGIRKKTIEVYSASVRLYESLNGLSLDELIEEADQEEEDGIRWKKRSVRNRLMAYRKYLYNTRSEGTANRYFSSVKTIYRHFEIELQPLPKFSAKDIDKTYEKSFEDIPNKEELIDAFHEANNVEKCIILFAISSGMSMIDFLNLTVDDFLSACSDYVEEDTVEKQLFSLKNQKNVIPYFEGTRQKTGSRFTTFCSPEAVEYIVQYLIGRNAQIREKYLEADEDDQEELQEALSGNDKLFNISQSHLLSEFKKINNKLKLGKVGKFTKFRCHQLRAYQASTLLNLEEGAFTESEVDALQGRKKDKTHRAYFVESKSKLQQKYIDSVDSLMLFKSIHGVDEEAFEKVKAENNFYKKEIVKNQQKVEEQQKVIDKILNNQRELEALLKL